jgi:diguanylate cyclase
VPPGLIDSSSGSSGDCREPIISDEMSRSTPRRRWLPLVPATVAAAGMWLWLLLGWGGPTVTRWADDIGCGVFSAVAAASMLSTARRQPPSMRRTWLMVGIGCVLWTLGEVAWCIYDLTDPGSVPIPSVADVGFLLLPVFGVVGLWQLPSQRETPIRRVLDAVLVGGSALLIWWVTVLDQMRQTLHGQPAGLTVTVAYPVLDVLLLTTAVLVAARAGLSRPRLLVLGSGLAVLTVADSMFAWLTASGGYASGAATDAAYMAAFALIAIAPFMRVERRQVAAVSDVGRFDRRRGIVTFVPFALAVGATLMRRLVGDDVGALPLVLWTLLAGCLLARQYLVIRENHDLVEELIAQRDQLRRSASSDSLTGLANRSALMEILERQLYDARHERLTVALLDINDFKLINDSHGHDTGDAVLVEIASRLRRTVRAEDLVARLGGDEFAVVARDIDDDGTALAERLQAAFVEPVRVGSRRFKVRASVGVIVASDTDHDAHTLLAHADVAMYQAKDGKDRSPASSVLLTGPRRLEAAKRLRLREEIGQPSLDQFSVAYQPVVDLATGRIRGVEALLRWTHPELGAVSPTYFIPLAEQAGSVALLGEHVLRTAAADLARLREVRPGYRLAAGINVSPVQLTDPELVGRIESLRCEFGLDASQFVLEVTEEALVEDLEVVASTIQTLVECGYSVAVDDFGTGYSSLRYLQRFMLDVLKIERTFVATMTAGARGATLVQSVIQMSAALDLQVIAEGIETIDQLRLLQTMNCELGQGFLFSPPTTYDQIESLIATGHVYPVGAGDEAPLLPEQRATFDRSLRIEHG